MRLRPVIAWAVILLLATGCARTVATGSQTPSQPDSLGLVAPQTVDADSPVKLTVVPTRVRTGGQVEVRLSVAPGGDHPWTANYVWLDKNVNGSWETAWILTRTGSASIQTVRKQFEFPDVGISVPGVMAFTLDPAPPPGEYRLRLAAWNGNEHKEGPGQPPRPTYWSTAMIEVAA